MQLFLPASRSAHYLALLLESGRVGLLAELEHDIDAVACGLTTRWSSGPVEGRVNHIKMLKRQMYGRAGLPLLRKRVLLTAAGGSRAGKRAR